MRDGKSHTRPCSWFSVWAMLPVFILFVPCALGQDVTWITVEGIARMVHVSKEKARAQAIEDAVQKAVEKMIGTISIEALMLNFRLSGSIVGIIPYVQVVQKEIIEEGMMNLHPERHDVHSPVYRVKMKAAVAVETTGVDPHFKIESSLNRLSFKDGDEMLMHIRPTKDCYILVFVVLEDGKVLRLVPNRFKKDNFVKANETFSFPDDIDKSMGIRLKTHGSKDKDVVNEAIYIVAFKQPFKLGADRFREAIYGIYNGHTAFMKDLVKEIVRIPLSNRAEKLLPYRISSGKVVDGVMEYSITFLNLRGGVT